MRFLSRKGFALLLFCAGVVLADAAPALGKCARGRERVRYLCVRCLGRGPKLKAKVKFQQPLEQGEIVTFVVDAKEYQRPPNEKRKMAWLKVRRFPRGFHTIRVDDAMDEFECR